MIYKKNLIYRMRKVGDKIIIFGDNRGFEINITGKIVWENIDTMDLDDIVYLVNKSDIPDIHIQVKEDVLEFINFLLDNELIKIKS